MIDRDSKVGTATRYELVEHLLGGGGHFFFSVHPGTGGHPAFCTMCTVYLSQAKVFLGVALSLLAPYTFNSILVMPQYCMQRRIRM